MIRLGGIGDPHDEVPTRAVNELSQAILTVGAWVAVLGILTIAIHMARSRHSIVPIGIVVAPGIMVLGEPLWDSVYHLYWYKPGQWTAFTSFGIPQPVWVVAIYVVIYAGGALWIGRALARGATRQYLLKAFVVAAVLVGILETSVIASGVYEYYGEHPFKIIGKYPVWCAIMEGAHVAVFAVLVHRIGPMLSGWRVLLFFPVFSFSFMTVMYGAALPALFVINAEVPTVISHGAVIISVITAAATVWMTAQLLPSTNPDSGILVRSLRIWAGDIENNSAPSAQPGSSSAPAPDRAHESQHVPG